MRIKIIKGLISIYGVMVPGMTITVPQHIAMSWIKNGIAESLEEPKDIPAGMFWCRKHQTLHKLTSRPGKSCLKRQVAEDEKAEAEAEAEAQVEAKKAAEEETAKIAEEARLAGIGEKNARADDEPGLEPEE